MAATLKAEIVAGEIQAGRQLPTNAELQRRFRTTPVTVHRAIRSLVADGFVHTKERLGSFVVERLPHHSNYALVFPSDPTAPGEEWNWSRYYQVLTMAAAMMQQQTGLRLGTYHGIGLHADNEDRQRLLTQIARHQLAGIIFANHPGVLVGNPIVDNPSVPRVAFSAEPTIPNLPVIAFVNWWERALEHLHQQGRRRIAVLTNALTTALLNQIAAAFQERGLGFTPAWCQAAHWRDTLAVKHSVELLLDRPDGQRPDGLLIMDDNLVEAAVAGLMAAGVAVPEKVAVVAHANFPLPPVRVLPLTLLGYDWGECLRVATGLLDRQRRGETVPAVTAVSAVFEQERAPQKVAMGK